jgi:hypothetical protein
MVVTCPRCGDERVVPNELAGTRLRCKACGAEFRATAGRTGGAGPPPLPKPADPAPRRTSRPRREDHDEDDRPPDRGRRQPASDRDPRDRRESTYQRLKHNVPVRVGTLVVLLAVLGVLGWRLYLKVQADREAAAFNREMEERAAPALDYTAPPPKAAAAQFNKLVPEGLDLKTHEAYLALARRLIGKWEVEAPGGGADPQVEFREDGVAQQFYADRDGKPQPRSAERWQLVAAAGDGGRVEFWDMGRTRRLDFRLEDGDNRLVFVGTTQGVVAYRRQK